uniref:Secreted protein n=1 Tax=Engystomops pustulosus TaxID=76066 RepID=A0AAV6YJT4_ENGPU|nr:hypothetical protein GDO81_023974 [Engystomops pustulosus]
MDDALSMSLLMGLTAGSLLTARPQCSALWPLAMWPLDRLVLGSYRYPKRQSPITSCGPGDGHWGQIFLMASCNYSSLSAQTPHIILPLE